MELLIIGLFAYLMGSIPSSVWLGRLFYAKDIREFGSKNAGATNTFRVFGKKLGIAVLILDIGKGTLSILMAKFFFDYFQPLDLSKAWVTIVAALCCIIGHIFPVFAQFKGGKGVATSLGILLGMNLYPTLVCLGIFLLVFILSRIVSLASMSAAMSFPIVCYLLFQQNQVLDMVFNLTVAAMVVFAHRKNIVRLVNKEEPKMNFGNQKM